MRHVVSLAACLIAAPCAASFDGAITERDRPLIYAMNAVGVQYRYGGRSPETGFDCSGLVTHVFQRAWGMALPPGTDALQSRLSQIGHSADERYEMFFGTEPVM